MNLKVIIKYLIVLIKILSVFLAEDIKTSEVSAKASVFLANTKLRVSNLCNELCD